MWLAGLVALAAAFIPPAAEAISFTSPTPYLVGNEPRYITNGDFNGDSDPDLVATDDSGDLSVLLGSTGGTFAPRSVVPSGGNFFIAVSDFNGDTDPDLAVGGSSGANILTGGPGGSFSSATTYGVGNYAGWIAVGDFNGDSDPDLALASGEQDRVAILLGATGGTFTAPTTFDTGADSRPNSVVSGDFDGDSDLDLATAGWPLNPLSPPGGVTVLLGNGAGSFGSPTTVPVGTNPHSIVTADFNDDNDPDLAVLDGTSVAVLTGGAGASFSAPTSFPSGNAGSQQATIGDFNGDSDEDVAVAGSGFVSVLLGGLGASFGSSAGFDAGGQANTITSADFDADSDRDLAAAGGGAARVMLQRPDAPVSLDTDPDSPADDNTVSVTGSARAGTTVKLYTTSDCTGSPAATGTAAAFASPGLAATVVDDSTTSFRATATDSGNNTSACSDPVVYVEDSTAPDPPTLTDTDPDPPANDNSPEFKGSAEAGSTVKLYTTTDCTGSPAATGTAADFASPGLTFAVADDASTAVRGTATDPAGHTSTCSSPLSYVEDSTPPAPPAITDTDPDSPSPDASPEVKGTAEADSSVRVFKTSDCSGAPEVTGTAAAFAAPGLAVVVSEDALTNLRATATDQAGNTSACSSPSAYLEDSSPPADFALTGPPDNALLAGARPNLSWEPASDGAGSGVSSYEVEVDGNAIATGLPAGTTSFSPASDLADGGHRWQVVVVDLVGNARTSGSRGFSIDTKAPVAAFTAAPNPLLAGRSVTFDGSGSSDASSSVVRWEWDLDGDGSFETDGGSSPRITRSYPVASDVGVGLRVTDGVGLTGDATLVLRVLGEAPPPGALGVSINDGAQFTNTPEVTIAAVWPSFATQMLVANDGGFAGATPRPLAARFSWTLASSGSERLPKIVYVRFFRGALSRDFSDDIILDETRPELLSARSASARTAAVRTSAAPRVVVEARDNASGVRALLVSQRRGGKARKYAYKGRALRGTRLTGRLRGTVTLRGVPSSARAVFVRAVDGAGNRSKQRKVALR